MLNNVSLMGRVGRDPEIRTGNSGEFGWFTIAVDRDYRDKQTGERPVDWFRVAVFRQTATFCQQYVHKGMTIGVSGRLQTRKIKDKAGNETTLTEVLANNVYFAEPAQGGQNRQQASGFQSQQPREYQTAGPKPQYSRSGGFQDLEDDDSSLPF